MFSFIETRLFTKLVVEYPDVGPVIPGSGGIRKIRWAAQGRGKRGGVLRQIRQEVEDG
jgi:hypothetical protein